MTGENMQRRAKLNLITHKNNPNDPKKPKSKKITRKIRSYFSTYSPIPDNKYTYPNQTNNYNSSSSITFNNPDK
jgi:hypothetical protein